MKRLTQTALKGDFLGLIPYYMGIATTNPESTGRFMSSLPHTPTPSSPDARLTQLINWIATLGLVDAASARQASTDASFRRYYRLDVLPARRADSAPP